MVTEVRQGTPAAEAGLRAATGSAMVAGQSYPTGGDVITAVDGTAITDGAELQSAVDAKSPGDSVELTYTREGTSTTVRCPSGPGLPNARAGSRTKGAAHEAAPFASCAVLLLEIS